MSPLPALIVSALESKSQLVRNPESFRKERRPSRRFFTSPLVNYSLLSHIDIPAFGAQGNNVSRCRENDKIVLVISLEDETMRARG